MKIRRHCTERLSHGERAWRQAARLAGFKGILTITGLGSRPASRRELKSPKRKQMGVTYAWFNSKNGNITVFIPKAKCAVPDKKAQQTDPFIMFLHELGHHRQKMRGISMKKGSTPETPLKKYRVDPLERAADRYAYRLARRLGYQVQKLRD